MPFKQKTCVLVLIKTKLYYIFALIVGYVCLYSIYSNVLKSECLSKGNTEMF